MMVVYLVLELHHLLLVLLQLGGGEIDHFLQLLLQHRLAVRHRPQLSLQSLDLLLQDQDNTLFSMFQLQVQLSRITHNEMTRMLMINKYETRAVFSSLAF